MLLFFFNDTATTEIYTLSLHDALPIFRARAVLRPMLTPRPAALLGSTREYERRRPSDEPERTRDRKSTRLNSSHANISYAVFCLKKKNRTNESSRSPPCI